MKYQNVNSKIKVKWYVGRFFLTILFITFLVISIVFIPNEEIVPKMIVISFLSLISIICIITLFIANLQYGKYRYAITSEEIIISRGLIFKSYFCIPFIQIQDVGYTEGPIDLLLKLASVRISTAGSNHAIEGIDRDTATNIVNQIKEKVKETLTNTERK